MPLPLAAAAVAVGRKAALSAARRSGAKTQKRFRKSPPRVNRAIGETDAETRKKISWVEIIFVALVFALPNDLLDIVELTGFGKMVTILIEPLTLFLLFSWFWFRVKERPGKKVIKNIISFVAEVIPVIGLAPIWTLLVINAKTGWFDPVLNIPSKIFKL